MRNLILTTLLTITSLLSYSQEFDRVAAKNIKTEINLTRISRSMSPADVDYLHQGLADSLNLLYFEKYKESVVETSKGIDKDFTGMHDALEAEMDKMSSLSYNFFIIHDAENFKGELKEMMWDVEAHFYKLSVTEISISVIRYDNKFIITILS